MGRLSLRLLAGAILLGFAIHAAAAARYDINVCKNPAECSVHAR